MTVFEILAALITLTAAFAWINHRYARLPATIGVMVVSLVFSLGLVALGRMGLAFVGDFARVIETVAFDRALLQGMLGALLFAGALHIDLGDLAEQKLVIALLATVGLVVSTLVVGFGSWWVFSAVGLAVPLTYCLLFGALISPTDPIAVLAILKSVGVPRTLEIKIAGESLFNDGVGVVLFLVILDVAAAGHGPSVVGVAQILAIEVGGGIAFGALVGVVAYWMLKSVDSYQIEILVTLAIVTGAYALALRMHLSGPLAMVVAGLLIGNHGRTFAMSERTRERLDGFWELIDEFLNAILFVLIGVEVLIVEFPPSVLAAGLVAIPLTLLGRWFSVSTSVLALRPWRRLGPHRVKILTWGGLRGGISVALALSLPPGGERDVIVAVTYVIVSFSIIVQGLSMGPMVRRLEVG